MARGDSEAFTAFYHAVFMRLYRYLLVCSGGDEPLVQEAMQETMVRVLRKIKPFDQATALWTWLCCVARSALIDQLRKEHSAKRRSVEPTVLDERPEPSQQDISCELYRCLDQSLDELDPVDRGLIEGKYFQGQTYQALALAWHLTPKAIESRLARIRKKLKERLLKRLHHET
jgi:RNA polymerase sigma factor (sigma-70 family)